MDTGVETIGRIDPKEIEPLYWIIEDALYDSQMKRATCVFRLLCHIAKHHKDLIAYLHPKQRERLKEIAYQIYDHETWEKRKAIEMMLPISAKPLPFDNESALEDYLFQHPMLFEPLLGESIKMRGRQVKTDFDYACDLTAESDKFFYPIELKIGQSKHGVISQIQKYCFYFYRQLRYDRHKEVRGVVVANGFCHYSLNELRRLDVIIADIIVDCNGDGVCLRKVD